MCCSPGLKRATWAEEGEQGVRGDPGIKGKEGPPGDPGLTGVRVSDAHSYFILQHILHAGSSASK